MKTTKGTTALFDEISKECLAIIEKKLEDYGTSWEILRPSSLTDQIFIKAMRIRTIQVTKKNLVGEPIENEFKGIINYSLIALYKLDRRKQEKDLMLQFRKLVAKIRKLLIKKNHDYGEAWRELRISSLTDLILQKLVRLRQIEDNDYVTTISEDAHNSYEDIVNYSIFALIHIKESKDPMK